MKNLHELHMASMDNVGGDCRGFFGTTLEDRQGGMCGGPWGTTHDNLLNTHISILFMFNSK